jgi:hypothetical protein
LRSTETSPLYHVVPTLRKAVIIPMLVSLLNPLLNCIHSPSPM